MKKFVAVFLMFITITSYCQNQFKYYSKNILEKDLDLFKEKISNIHPLFLDSNFYNKWQKDFNNVKNSLKDSSTLNDFYLAIAPLEACLKDAHSNFICPFEQRQQFMLNGGLSFPFSVTIENNSVFVKEYYGIDSLLFFGGEEILKINSIPITNILIKMHELTGSEVNYISNYNIETVFRTYLWMLFNFNQNYELQIKDNNGKISNKYINGITNDQFLRNKKRYPEQNQKMFTLKIEDSLSTSLLILKNFSDLSGFCKFADSAFQEISKRNSKYLIIDIRGNLGGRSIVVDSLMNYLTDKKYSQYKKIETRISKELKEYYKEKYPEKYEAIKDNSINEIKIMQQNFEMPLNPKNRFKGKMYLLTDKYTYSGASTFAGIFKELSLGTIIGEETGGRIEYYGDFWYQTLPNTQLQFFVSPKQFIQYGGTDMERGVIPDITIPNKNDSILKFTYNFIAKQLNN